MSERESASADKTELLKQRLAKARSKLGKGEATEGIAAGAAPSGVPLAKQSEVAHHALPIDKNEALKQRLAKARQKLNTAEAPAGADSPPRALALSSIQKRLWFLEQFDAQSASYNMYVLRQVDGLLDPLVLQRALEALAQRHQVLRARYVLERGADEPTVRLEEKANISVRVEDLREHADATTRSVQALLDERIAQEIGTPFRLADELPLRCSLYTTADNSQVLLLVVHHIASDAYSVGILMAELASDYAALAIGGESTIAAPKVQYVDFAAWQNAWLQGDRLKAQLSYWRERLQGAPDFVSLPADRPRPATQTANGALCRFRIEGDLLADIRRAAAQAEGTVFMFMLTAYFALFHRYAEETDLVVGIPISGRTRTEFESLIGAFINTLALRVKVSPAASLRELLAQVRDTVLDAFSNQELPFDKIIEALKPQRNASYSPIFQLMFNYIHTGQARVQEMGGHKVSPYAFERPRAKTDLSLELVDNGTVIHGRVIYNTDLFDHDTAQRFSDHYLNVVRGMVSQIDTPLAELDFLTADERHMHVAKGDALAPEPAATMHALFEEQARQHPSALALCGNGSRLTYRELDERANRLAHYLEHAGIQLEDRVGIFMERNTDVVVAMLAVLKAGGAYVPIDVTNPIERVAAIVEEAGIRIIVTHDEFAAGLSALNKVRTVRLDADAPALHGMSSAAPAPRAAASHLMYVLFTSGSTGRPKGVGIEHGHYHAFFSSITRRMAVRQGEHFAIVSTFAADLGTPMIWGALATGGCLHVMSYEDSIDPDAFRAYLQANPVDVIKIVPSHFRALAGSGGADGLLPRRLVVFGGESSFWGTFRQIWASRPDLEIQISYGPTETTVTATAYQASDDPRYADDDVVPIGQPLDHVRVHVLDKAGRPRPYGLPGELYIGGDAVARGYLNQDALTAQKFVVKRTLAGDAQRLYATGDLVRWRSDGQLHFLGRGDDQVKIRGYRIELGEIRAAIKDSPLVDDAVVIVYKDAKGVDEIGAYLVLSAQQQAEFDPTVLRDFLRERVPSYMVPRSYLPIAAIPLNANGKVDRKALPEMHSVVAAHAGSAQAETPMEHRLLEVWKEVLGQAEIGIDDNFFDMGGDSFKAIRVARAADARMSVIDVFKYPTIRELARRMSTKSADEKFLLVELTPPNATPVAQRINLICVPYGGGNAITFQPLANALPAHYSLFAVELPGHDFSKPQESFKPLEEVAAECLAEIREKTEGRLVIYGHCLGGALAIELARLIEEQSLPLAGVVMGGNFPVPRLTGAFFTMWEKLFPRERMISDRAIIDMLRLWGGFLEVISVEEQKFMVKALRHDRMEAEAYYTRMYAAADIAPLRAPLMCVCGDADRTTEFFEERYRDWGYFSRTVTLETIPRAGHYFHKYQADVLARLIDERCVQALPVPRSDAQVASYSDAAAPVTNDSTARRKEAAAQLARLRRTQQTAPSMSLFMWVALGQLLATLGSGITGFALGVWVYETTHVATDFALVSILTLAPGLLILPFAGAIADRYDRRLILLASNVVAVLSTLLVAAMLWVDQLSIWAVYAAALIGSIAGALQRPAYLAAVAQIAPKRHLGQANGVSQMVAAAGTMLAPMLGGLLFKAVGLSGIVVIHVVAFVVSFMILASIRFPNAMFRQREEPVLTEIVGGFRYLLRRRNLMVMIGFFLVFNLVWGIPTVLVTPLVLSLDSPSALGLIVAAMGAGTIIGGAVMGVWGGTVRRANGMVGFVVLAGVSFVLLGATPNLTSVAIGAFLSRVALALINTHWQAIIQSKVGLELQGRVFAINFLLANLLLPVGSYLAGWLSDKAMPAMFAGGIGQRLLAPFAAFGSAQGMALLVCVSGVFMLVWGVLGLLYKPLRLMEDYLPDAIPDVVILEDKDKLQELADLQSALNTDPRRREFAVSPA